MGYEVISSLSAPSGGIFEFTGLSLTGYDMVRLVLEGVETDTGGADFICQVGTGGAYLTLSGNYFVTHGSLEANGTAHSLQSETGTGIAINDGTISGLSATATHTCGSILDIYNPGSTTRFKSFTINNVLLRATALRNMFTAGGGQVRNTGALDRIKIIPDSGNFDVGRATLIGWNSTATEEYVQIHRTTTLSGGLFDITGLSFTGYADVIVEIRDIVVSADDTELRMQTYHSGVLATANYQMAQSNRRQGTSYYAEFGTASAYVLLTSNDATLGIGTDTGETFGGWYHILGAERSNLKHLYGWAGHNTASGNIARSHTTCLLPGTGAVTGFKIYPDTGSISSGEVIIMGIPY